MESLNDPQPPTRCPKCDGAMATYADAHGAYLRCFQCGNHIELITREGQLTPRPPSSPKWAPDASLPGIDTYTCNEAPACTQCPLPFCKYEVNRYDQTQAHRKKHQAILKTIADEDLSVGEAAERFGLSLRTIFRIKANGRLQPPL